MKRRDRDEPDDETFGIDDFAWVVDDPAPPPEPGAPRLRGFRSWLRRAAAFALLGGAAAWVVARAMGYAVPFALIVTVLFAGSVLRRTLAEVAAPKLRFVTEPPPLGRAPIVPGAIGDGLHLAMARWDNRLTFTDRDAARFANSVQPRLTEIVDERLRLRHGVTRAADPARARQLVGERLWMLLHIPVTRSPTPHQLVAILAEVEEI